MWVRYPHGLPNYPPNPGGVGGEYGPWAFRVSDAAAKRSFTFPGLLKRATEALSASNVGDSTCIP